MLKSVQFKFLLYKNIIIFITILFFGLIHNIYSNQSNENEILRKILDSNIKKFSNYNFDKNTKLDKRINLAPDFVINTWMKWDKRDNYTNYSLSPGEMEIVTNYLKILPEIHTRLLKERLIGIYFIKYFLGSGLADWVIDENGEFYYYIIFNSKVLKKNISEFVTYKDRTCFKKNNNDFKIYIDCGRDYNGFLNILLHETTHVVDCINNITPYVEKFLNKIQKKKVKSEFCTGIWKNYSLPVEKYDFAYRKFITFYKLNKGPKINISDAAEVYTQLKSTPFISLFGSMSWAEDLVEFVAYYHLTEVLKQPYKIKVLKNNKIIMQYEPMKSDEAIKRSKLIKKYFYSQQ